MRHRRQTRMTAEEEARWFATSFFIIIGLLAIMLFGMMCSAIG